MPARARRSIDVNQFLEHYLTPFFDPGDPDDPDDDISSCSHPAPPATGGRPAARASTGSPGSSRCRTRARTRSSSRSRSPTRATRAVQLRGVTLDNLVVSTGEGSTSFEDDGDTLDGWVVGDAPEGSAPNENTWTTITELEPPPPPPPAGVSAQASFARQPEIINFLSGVFGRYPFKASGGIVDDSPVGFALETQTRPVYTPVFFFGGPNDGVVVHELAHQWYGDSLAVEAWQHIWLNEGFATYTEWLWSATRGRRHEQEIFDFCYKDVFPARTTSSGSCRSGTPGPTACSTSPSTSGAP